jgi:exonuclease III
VTNFLFWNFNTKFVIKHPESIVARTALGHDVDLLILAESSVQPEVILAELNRDSPDYHYPANPHDRFVVFTRFSGVYLEPFEDHPRVSVRRLRLPGKQDILIATIHFPDKRNHSRQEQHSLSIIVAQFIRDAEERAGHDRTVLVGDFNMNPFEEGMVDANGFGAMMTKDLVRKLSRAGVKSGPRFYNPAWSRLGDLTDGPPGTFYHRQNNLTNTYWHMLDQVLIRPALIDSFSDKSFRILDKLPIRDGDVDLVQEKTIHWKLRISDHLPILFSMNLPEDVRHE